MNIDHAHMQLWASKQGFAAARRGEPVEAGAAFFMGWYSREWCEGYLAGAHKPRVPTPRYYRR